MLTLMNFIDKISLMTFKKLSASYIFLIIIIHVNNKSLLYTYTIYICNNKLRSNIMHHIISIYTACSKKIKYKACYLLSLTH